MAVSSRGKTSPASRGIQKKEGNTSKRKYIIIACILLVFIGICALFRWVLPSIFYYKNPRLQFNNLEVDSTGFWQKNGELLQKRIGLNPGTNIFEISPSEIRNRLEKDVPGIEKAEVRIVLPDTVKVKLIERIPRASLYSVNSPFVVDKDGIPIKRAESSAGNQRLPVIKGLRNANITEQTRPALRLIMSALGNYPDIAIQEISLIVPGELRVQLYYRERKRCIVLFPADAEEDYNYLLSVLQTTILRSGSNWTLYDLRYRGSVSGR